MCCTSTAEVVFPGFADLTLVLLNDLVQLLQLPLVQSLEVRQSNRRLKPELCFASGGQDMNMDACFFP